MLKHVRWHDLVDVADELRVVADVALVRRAARVRVGAGADSKIWCRRDLHAVDKAPAEGAGLHFDGRYEMVLGAIERRGDVRPFVRGDDHVAEVAPGAHIRPERGLEVPGAGLDAHLPAGFLSRASRGVSRVCSFH